MRKSTLLLAALLMTSAAIVQAGDRPAHEDNRYPVTLTPQEALQQKDQMRHSLVALRQILGALAKKDFSTVERSLRGLAHQDKPSAQQVVTTSVYRKLEAKFQADVEHIVAAARRQDMQAVLQELSDTMSSCQACHAALRQEVVPAEPDETPPKTK